MKSKANDDPPTNDTARLRAAPDSMARNLLRLRQEQRGTYRQVCRLSVERYSVGDQLCGGYVISIRPDSGNAGPGVLDLAFVRPARSST